MKRVFGPLFAIAKDFVKCCWSIVRNLWKNTVKVFFKTNWVEKLAACIIAAAVIVHFPIAATLVALSIVDPESGNRLIRTACMVIAATCLAVIAAIATELLFPFVALAALDWLVFGRDKYEADKLARSSERSPIREAAPNSNLAQ